MESNGYFTVSGTFYLAALIAVIPFTFLWMYLRKRKTVPIEYNDEPKPLPLQFGPVDYLKAFVSWVFLFMAVYQVRPGLYYIGHIGDGDGEKPPLLVTANNFLTVFLLARNIGQRPVRLLVIDTGGINVWCSGGKGKFSAGEISKAATKYGIIKEGAKETVILPKFSLAGVSIKDVGKSGLKPVIGPLYAKDVPAYLDEGKFKNRVDDTVYFGWQSRAFTALPTAVQFFYYFLWVYVISLGNLSSSVVWIATGLAFAYPLLFPYLPGKLFSVKGLWLATAVSLGVFPFHYDSPAEWLWLAVFFFATSIFIALSYTGNSAVSNYTSVRKETAVFLPVTIVLYILLVPITIYM